LIGPASLGDFLKRIYQNHPGVISISHLGRSGFRLSLLAQP
jgi:hypothetical protein